MELFSCHSLWDSDSRVIRTEGSEWRCGPGQCPPRKGICIIAEDSCSRGSVRTLLHQSESPEKAGPLVCWAVVTQLLKHWELVISHGASIYTTEIYKHCKSGRLFFGEPVFQHPTSEDTQIGRFKEVLGTIAKVWAGCREAQGIVQYPGGWSRWAGGGGKGAVSASEIESPWEGYLQPETLRGQLGNEELTSLSGDLSSDRSLKLYILQQLEIALHKYFTLIFFKAGAQI